MGYQLKNGIKETWSDARTIAHNLFEFLDAIFLAVVSGDAIYIYIHNKHTLWYYALGLSGVAIALQAFVLLAKHFNKKG